VQLDSLATSDATFEQSTIAKKLEAQAVNDRTTITRLTTEFETIKAMADDSARYVLAWCDTIVLPSTSRPLLECTHQHSFALIVSARQEVEAALLSTRIKFDAHLESSAELERTLRESLQKSQARYGRRNSNWPSGPHDQQFVHRFAHPLAHAHAFVSEEYLAEQLRQLQQQVEADKKSTAEQSRLFDVVNRSSARSKSELSVWCFPTFYHTIGKAR
jgi:hypothetical protein